MGKYEYFKIAKKSKMNRTTLAKNSSNKIEMVFKLKEIANLKIALTVFQKSTALNFTTFTGHTVIHRCNPLYYQKESPLISQYLKNLHQILRRWLNSKSYILTNLKSSNNL